MKKFLLTLAAVAFASSVLMAQTPVPNTTQEEPDRVANRHLSKNPTGNDIPTGYDKPQVVKGSPRVIQEEIVLEKEPKHECKDHKDGQPCTKPADQQCPDCKAKAANAPKHECKKGAGQECKEGMKRECKKGEGQACKDGMKHECKKGEGQACKDGMKHECKKGEGQACKEGMKRECKKGEGQACKKAEGMKHECKKGAGQECKKAEGMKHECKDHKDGQPCTKPADQQCPDCKAKAKKN